LTDFDEIVKSYSVRMPLPAWLRSPAEKLVLGLKNLEVLYVIGGDDGERLFLPWSPQARVKTERHGNEVKKVVVGKWTGEEEVEFVGLGEGTFQKQHNRFEGTRGEGDGIMGNPLPPTIDDVEERWKVVVEQAGKKEGMGEWIPPRVVGLEVKCREE
jgi:hypothetical protein